MKIILKVFLGMILVISSLLVKAEDNLIVSGTINSYFDGRTIVMERVYTFPTTQARPKAECMVKEGKFCLTLPATAIEQYHISIKDDTAKKDAISILLMPEKTEITFAEKNLVNYTLVGNKASVVFKNSLIPILNRKKYTSDEVIKGVTVWIENHQDSPLNTYLISIMLVNNVSDDEILRLMKLIPPSDRKGTYYDELSFITANLYVGSILPDFEQADTNGVAIKLSAFRGKYILVNFWASWCRPCRAENPQLVVAMQKYHQKNFGIISVSLDDKKNLWQEAIRKDGLQNWIHVSDLMGWNNSISVNYRIRSVPKNFLIDPEGRIIAKDLRGKEVLDLLGKLMD